MMRATQKKSKGKQRKSRFAGICAAARRLEVERSHLYRVLSGKRISPGLLGRYRALKDIHNQTVASARTLADIIDSRPATPKNIT
jgi:hypothetical protein